MIRAYLLAAVIFTIGELAVRAGGRLLSPRQRIRLRRISLSTTVLLPLAAWLLALGGLTPSLPALTTTEIPFDILPGGEIAHVGAYPALAEAGTKVASQLPWAQLLQLGLVVGFAIAALRLAAAFLSLLRLVRSASSWDLDGASNVYVHEGASIPFSTIVSGRALVVLPAWMHNDLTHARVAVAHELQHIRNRDPHWAIVLSIAAAALWWHPFRRSWRRSVELDQELVCDNEVLHAGIGRKEYWETLLTVASRVVDTPVPQLALGMAGSANQDISNLERRIRAMQQQAKRVTKGRFLGLGAAIVAAQAWVACGSMSPRDAAQMQALSLGELPAQTIALNSLAKGMQSSKARSGRVIVTQIQTGQILAAGGFDETGIQIDPQRALTEPVRAWSLAKPALVALALEEGLTTPTSQFDTSKKTVALSGDEIRDYKPLGILTTSDVLAKSSNVGAVQIARLVGLDSARAGMSHFHLDGLGGNVTDVADIAIGKGVVAPLSLLRFYEAIANGGDLIIAPATGCGSVPTVEHVLSAQTSNAMLEMLRRVVTHGTGRRAASDFQVVGGKTATGRRSAAFLGLMPRLAVWVLLENGDGIYGGKDAAPVARDIMETIQTANLLPDC